MVKSMVIQVVTAMVIPMTVTAEDIDSVITVLDDETILDDDSTLGD